MSLVRWLLAAVLAGAFSAMPATAGAVTVTIGPPSFQFLSSGVASCTAPCNSVFSQSALSSPPGLVQAPADGTITEWRVVQGGSGDATLHLRVLRPLPGGVFASVGRSAAATQVAGTAPNPVSLPIQAGDYLGAEAAVTDLSAGVSRSSTGGGFANWNSLPDGTQSVATGGTVGVLKLNATVVLAVPEVLSLTPSSGSEAGGQGVVVSGLHFSGATQVMFGSVPAPSFSVNSNTQIIAVAPPGSGTVDLTVTGPGGTSAAAAGSKYTYGVPDDGKRPAIALLTMQPTRFVAANTGPTLIAATVGSQVIYELSEPASTRFTVQRALKGRRKGRKCVPPRRSPRGRRCTRYRTVKGNFSHAGATGLNRFRFMGRLRGRALKRGNYRLVAVASDALGNRSRPKRRAFRIVR